MDVQQGTEPMGRHVVEALNDMNADFYRKLGASFSATRQSPWDGWERVASEIDDALPSDSSPLNILDVGCGNMRFEAFLRKRLPHRRLAFRCLDACDALAQPDEAIAYDHVDIVQCLLDNSPVPGLDDGAFDAAVAFGFMHHVPGIGQRKRLMDRMVGCVRGGGVIAVSFWQLLDDERLLRKAQAATPAALGLLAIGESDLEDNDAFLGWSDEEAYRYCHHFSDDEIDFLLERQKGRTRVLADYSSDRSNRYVILERA